MDLETYYKKISTFNLDEALRKVIHELEAEILDANILQQKELGVDSNGVKIGSYNTKYALWKGIQGLLTNNDPTIVNLEVDGDFHNDFYLIDASPNTYEVDSKDEKTDELVSQYGKDIFGLTDTSLEDLKPAIMELLIEDMKNV